MPTHPRCRSLMIIWASLTASVLVYFGVAVVSVSSAGVAGDALVVPSFGERWLSLPTTPIDSVLGLMGVSSFIFSLIIPPVIYNRSRLKQEIQLRFQREFSGDLGVAREKLFEKMLDRFFVALIIRWAITETIAVFGFLSVMLAHRFNVVSTTLLSVGFLALLLSAPRFNKLQEDLNHWLTRS